jgi:hypothetical protein
MATLFFSYSHKDEDLRDRLETHLAMLKREGIIETWHDRRIAVGDGLSGAIDEQLEKADVILLLVSPDFLASNYCYDVEMARAMDRHRANEARVIPVILRHCDWRHAPFGKLLAAPKDGKPIVSWPDLDEAFVDVVQQIRAALPRVAPAPSTSAPTRSGSTQNPLPAPRSSNLRMRRTFSEIDRDRFLDEAFEYMARFFETSMGELEKRNSGVEARFRRIDSNRFVGTVYLQGKAVSRCKVVLGGMFGKEISYSFSDQPTDGSINESLRVDGDDQNLFLKPLGMAQHGSGQSRKLTFEGAAEYYWSLFIQALQ